MIFLIADYRCVVSVAAGFGDSFSFALASPDSVVPPAAIAVGMALNSTEFDQRPFHGPCDAGDFLAAIGFWRRVACWARALFENYCSIEVGKIAWLGLCGLRRAPELVEILKGL